MAPARWRNFVHQPRAFIARASIAPAKNWRNPTDPTGASALARPSTTTPSRIPLSDPHGGNTSA